MPAVSALVSPLVLADGERSGGRRLDGVVHHLVVSGVHQVPELGLLGNHGAFPTVLPTLKPRHAPPQQSELVFCLYLSRDTIQNRLMASRRHQLIRRRKKEELMAVLVRMIFELNGFRRLF